jgi:hypothetical protein
MAGQLAAQDEPKPETPPAAAAESQPAEAAPAAAQETPPPAVPASVTPPAPPTIPPQVEAKLEAARRAVAEAIVAAEDAGLVDSSIDPPPILDILINGYANDRAVLKAVTTEKPEAGLSPEVFGAWFTGYGKPMDGITAEKNVKIVPPSQGLKAWYDKRAEFLRRHIAEVRKARGSAEPTPAATPSAEPSPAPTATEPKAEEPKVEEPKAEESQTEAPPAAAPSESGDAEAQPAEASAPGESQPAAEPPSV